MSRKISDRVRFQAASDQSLLIYFGEQITLESHEKVRDLMQLLRLEPISGVRNLQPAYHSLLLNFDLTKSTHHTLEKILRGYLDRVSSSALEPGQMKQIPTCYGGEFGPDLDEVARLHGLTTAQAIELHASVTYTVFFLGFVPGFAYLGKLPDALATPRLATPRRTTPAGSVGIAENQTGVYPFATPGGWRLIGRTPIKMFRPDRPEMNFLAIGDQVRFTPISASRFAALENA
jgi:KipI family sensor histidine kinase inhibitor